MFNENELFFHCPYCAQQISFLVEDLYGEQSYIEDCEVCCQPIQIQYKIENDEVLYLNTEKAD